MGEVERFAFARGEAFPDGTGGWVTHSDHLAALMEREDRERSIRQTFQEHFDKANARAEKAEAHLAKAVEEFEKRAAEHHKQRLVYAERIGQEAHLDEISMANASVEMGYQRAFEAAAQYLRQESNDKGGDAREPGRSTTDRISPRITGGGPPIAATASKTSEGRHQSEGEEADRACKRCGKVGGDGLVPDPDQASKMTSSWVPCPVCGQGETNAV